MNPSLLNISFLDVPVGSVVRRQIAKTTIFRVSPGNGYYGTVVGQQYQYKYAYFVPTSINNVQGQASRDAMAIAVGIWKNTLTSEQKAEYNRLADLRGGLSGFNLYVGEYIRAHA